jgi:hypothetical protein
MILAHQPKRRKSMKFIGVVLAVIGFAGPAFADRYELPGDKRVEVFASAGTVQGSGNGSTEKIVEPIRAGISVNLLPNATRSWLNRLSVSVAAGCAMTDLNFAAPSDHISNLGLSTGCAFTGSAGLTLSLYDRKYLHLGIFGEYWGTFTSTAGAGLTSLGAGGTDLTGPAAPRTHASNRFDSGTFGLTIATPVGFKHGRVTPYVNLGYNIFVDTVSLNLSQDLVDYLNCDHAPVDGTLKISKYRPAGDLGVRLDIHDFTLEANGTYIRSFVSDDYAWAVHGSLAYHFGKK